MLRTWWVHFFPQKLISVSSIVVRKTKTHKKPNPYVWAVKLWLFVNCVNINMSTVRQRRSDRITCRHTTELQPFVNKQLIQYF